MSVDLSAYVLGYCLHMRTRARLRCVFSGFFAVRCPLFAARCPLGMGCPIAWGIG